MGQLWWEGRGEEVDVFFGGGGGFEGLNIFGQGRLVTSEFDLESQVESEMKEGSD